MKDKRENSKNFLRGRIIKSNNSTCIKCGGEAILDYQSKCIDCAEKEIR